MSLYDNEVIGKANDPVIGEGWPWLRPKSAVYDELLLAALSIGAIVLSFPWPAFQARLQRQFQEENKQKNALVKRWKNSGVPLSGANVILAPDVVYYRNPANNLSLNVAGEVPRGKDELVTDPIWFRKDATTWIGFEPTKTASKIVFVDYSKYSREEENAKPMAEAYSEAPDPQVEIGRIAASGQILSQDGQPAAYGLMVPSANVAALKHFFAG